MEKKIATKIQNIYHNQRRRAKKHGMSVEFIHDELKDLVRRKIGSLCPCCGETLTGENFSADHDVPVSRGGRFTIEQTTIMCLPCNQTKGSLTTTEYITLLRVMSQWEERARKSVLIRLRVGSKIAKV